MKGKTLQPRILYPTRLLFRFDGEIKSFPDKQKVREFSTTKEFTANAKEISPSMKHKTRKRPTENKPKTIKENGNRIIHINNYLKCKWIKCSNQKIGSTDT